MEYKFCVIERNGEEIYSGIDYTQIKELIPLREEIPEGEVYNVHFLRISEEREISGYCWLDVAKDKGGPGGIERRMGNFNLTLRRLFEIIVESEVDLIQDGIELKILDEPVSVD